MSKLSIIFLSLNLLLGPQTLLAHPEHGFGIVNAEDEGKSHILRLINEKTLPETWRAAYADLDKGGMRTLNGKKRWVMVYENPEEKDPSKRVIRIILTPLGKFVSYEFVQF